MVASDIKLYGIYKSLKMTFKSCLNQIIFNVVPVYKKLDNQCVKNTDGFLFFKRLVKYLEDSFITL